jgi:hypothetical protein
VKVKQIITVVPSLQQSSFFFAPIGPSEDTPAQAVAAIPKADRDYVNRWMAILADSLNGTWKLYQGHTYAGATIRNGSDWINVRARMENLSARSVYAKLHMARQILKNPDIPNNRKWAEIAVQLRPKARPGRSSAAFFAQPENAWMWPELRRIYLNQAQFSKEATYRLLIDQKQRAHKLGHFYARPTR